MPSRHHFNQLTQDTDSIAEMDFDFKSERFHLIVFTTSKPYHSRLILSSYGESESLLSPPLRRHRVIPANVPNACTDPGSQDLGAHILAAKNETNRCFAAGLQRGLGAFRL